MVFENYAAHVHVSAAPLTCEILNFFNTWHTAAALARHFPQYHPRSLERAVRQLARANLLDSSTDRRKTASSFEWWATWGPAARFFHFSTKDTNVPAEPEDSIRALRRRARVSPMPAPVKSYPRAKQIALPQARNEGELAQALLERRTWRKFAAAPTDLDSIATLFGLTFGVQWWLDMPGVGRIALKTSPSGGSRHPIEAYLLAKNVAGIERGVYHYNAGSHRLELLRTGCSRSQIERYLNRQWWFGDASAIVLMTAVFSRTQWKYPAPRAYRAVLLEAGHLCQTFCLVATWLGLAPFCTMAMADSAIERELGIDGVTESVIYAAGVGTRPKGMEWAPWPARAYGKRAAHAAHPENK